MKINLRFVADARRSAFALLSVIALVAIAGITGCGGSSNPLDGVGCTAEVRAGVVVSLTDSRTGGTPTNTANIRVTITDGDYSSTLVPTTVGDETNPLTFSGAYERAGTYQVRIEAPGYVTPNVREVRVTRDICHVITQRLAVTLTPQQ